jgi:hypothetical protein
MRKLICALVAVLVASSTVPVWADVDLAIGFDNKTDRPNLFIAWRNTQRILEVELEVKNYGDQQATGRLVVYILDEEGKVLDSSPDPSKPILVTLPPSVRGGKEGKVVQMHGSKALNLLIDRLDRANTRYALKAEIITDGVDANPLNNVSVKTFNVNSQARPKSVHYYDYYFRNTTDKPVELMWQVETSPLPKQWMLTTEPKNGQMVRVEPGAIVQGYAILKTASVLDQGDHVDIRFAAVDKKNKTIFGQSEWFVVFDITPPEISGLAYSVDKETGVVEVTLTANDLVSMLREASGVRVEYSTDGGVTFSNKVLAYLDGNFVGPTRFRGELGPFAEKTQLAMSVHVEDIAGNKSQRIFEPIVIPNRSTNGKVSGQEVVQ